MVAHDPSLPTVLIRAADDIPVPQRASLGAAGYDICAAEAVTLEPSRSAAVSTGMRLSVPPGYEAQVRPRSGLAFKFGVTVLNAPGTIDADYRGEVKVILINHGPEVFQIEPGMRIAQLVFARVEQMNFRRVEELDESERGEGGFGSTGHAPMSLE